MLLIKPFYIPSGNKNAATKKAITSIAVFEEKGAPESEHWRYETNYT